MPWKIFVLSVVSALKVSKPSNSGSTWSVHKTSQHSWLKDSTTDFQVFKIVESLNFATKNNFCLSSTLISAQLHAGPSFYLTWLTSLSWLHLFSWFCLVFTWDKFCQQCIWRIAASAKICQVTTNHPHLQTVGDDRKFVQINNFFAGVERP